MTSQIVVQDFMPDGIRRMSWGELLVIEENAVWLPLELLMGDAA